MMYSCIYIKYVIMLIVIVVVDYCLGILVVVCSGLIFIDTHVLFAFCL